MSEKAQKMAWLYVNGPKNVQGEWNVAAREAGYARPPREENRTVLNYIRIYEEESGAAEIEELLEAAETEDWDVLASKARPILVKIGSGKIDATTQQMQALKEIVARGEGKIGQKSATEMPLGVVVLPVIGKGEESQICPRCLEREEEDD